MLWKSAFVSSVHKKGSRSEIVNYKPISKLCIIAKIFELIIYNQVYAALQNSFHPSQHGFLRGRSTVSNLVIFNDFLTEAMDNGHQVDVIQTDSNKAFDRIDHKLLLSKLSFICIRGDLIWLFSSYINNRSQTIVINNYISSWVFIPSGIPQGSLLFLIFINDISSIIVYGKHNSNLLCFADDMKFLK